MTPLDIEIDDLIVLLLGAPAGRSARSGQIEGITRLEKLVFLIEKEEQPKWLAEDAGFYAHNFGPFSAKVYDAADTLAAAGLVEDSSRLTTDTADSWEADNVIGTPQGDPYATRDFMLTALGREYYDALIKELPPGTEESLERFKRRYASLPLRRLIRYVYEEYPDFTDKSIIRDGILGQ